MGIRGERRWGEHAPGNEGEARERLLAAAEDCYERFGVAKTTVSDVARVAKVTRPTVYRYFEGRDALVRGVLLRDAERFRQALAARLDTFASLEEAVIEGLLFCLHTLPGEPRFRYLFAPDPGDRNPVEIEAVDLREIGLALLAPIFDRIAIDDGTDSSLSAATRAEWTLRVLLSFLRVPPAAPRRSATSVAEEAPAFPAEAEPREQFAQLLLPVLIHRDTGPMR